MTDAEALALAAFRRLVHDGIRSALAQDGHCKGYEGAIYVGMPRFPGVSSLMIPPGTLDGWVVKLDCYVLGPSRHYEWSRSDFGLVLARATADVAGWIEEVTRG